MIFKRFTTSTHYWIFYKWLILPLPDLVRVSLGKTASITIFSFAENKGVVLSSFTIYLLIKVVTLIEKIADKNYCGSRKVF